MEVPHHRHAKACPPDDGSLRLTGTNLAAIGLANASTWNQYDNFTVHANGATYIGTAIEQIVQTTRMLIRGM